MRVIQENYIEILGIIWLPPVKAALELRVPIKDVIHMANKEGKIHREEVEEYLTTHSGDFQKVIDFSAVFDDAPYGPVVIDWKDFDNEIEFDNIVYGNEEE